MLNEGDIIVSPDDYTFIQNKDTHYVLDFVCRNCGKGYVVMIRKKIESMRFKITCPNCQTLNLTKE